MTASKLTLPATGSDVITEKNGSDEHGQGVVLLRSDTLTPVTIDDDGQKVYLGVAIPPGDENIGNVDIVTVPADPFGANADAASATGSISAKLRQMAANGIPITAIVPGTAATSLGKAEDSAAGATDTGVKLLAVRDDALATLTPAEGDYAGLRVDSEGKLWTRAIIPDADGNPVTFSKPGPITLTPTVDTAAAYANLDNLSSAVMAFTGATVTDAGTGWLTKLVVFDAEGKLGANDVELELWLFSSSVSPPSANAAFSGLSAADRLKRVLKVSTADGVWDTVGSTTICEVGVGIAKPYHLTTGTTLYGAARILVPSTAPQWTTGTSVSLLLHTIPE